MLAREGATVAADGPQSLTVSGLPTERIVALLTAGEVPFSEIGAHRATLEEAYMELTRDAAEFRTVEARTDTDRDTDTDTANETEEARS